MSAEPRGVSPLELLYDLVFVFAASHLSWRGGLVLLCAVVTVWLLTTFEATYFDITRRHTQAPVLTAMAVGML